MNQPDLEAAARSFGVQTSYLDIGGAVVHSSPTAVRHVIDALVAHDGDAAVTGRFARGHDPLDVVVAWDGVAPRLPDDVTVHDDHGVLLDRLRALPFGYHRLVRADAPIGTVISAPVRAPAARRGQWGVLLPLYALRTARTRGIARYPELDDLFGWLDAHGGEHLLTLPLLPLYLDEPADWSPYSPVTRLLWNELYVDLDHLDPEGRGQQQPQPHEGLLDYPSLWRAHAARLDRVATREADDPDLLRFTADHPEAIDYARFRGAQHRLGRDWRTWPATITDADVDPVVRLRHLVGTWLADRQLGQVASAARSRGQCLALDLALGAHADGFDVWSHRDLFVPGMSVGAPPDPIFSGGQDWGFPPVHPAASRANGHAYFRATLRHHLRHAGLLRLDHVMGLARQWWVPHGGDASDGVYVQYPLEELFAVVCLEAHLAGAVIVGENLGTVPAEVDDALVRHGLLGIHVGQEALPSFGTDHVKQSGCGTMAMLTTHDSVPFASWWKCGDIRRSHEMGLMTDGQAAEQAHHRGHVRDRVVHQLATDHLLEHDRGDLQAVMAGVAERLAAEPAEIVVLNLEDLWLEERVQNSPGTFQEVPNWRRVAARTVEELAADAAIDRVITRVAKARALTR